MTFTPFARNRFLVNIGPVKSGKTRDLEAELDAALDGGLMNNTHILVVKHPFDDPENPDKIGKHPALSTPDPGEIADSVSAKTSNVVIAGISHYKAPEIVQLVDALIRSGRGVIASALNLDYCGKPYGNIAQLMAIADDVKLKKALCFDCGDTANRSFRKANSFHPTCTHHYHYAGSPRIDNSSRGNLELFLGNMYAGKSKMWKERIDETQINGLPYLVFKWFNDDRGRSEGTKLKLFDTDFITIRNDGQIPAITVRNADDIREYINRTQNGRVNRIFVDELHFIDGIYDLAFELLARGYKIYGTGLPRPFKRIPFGDVPALMCLADEINMRYAYCEVCFSPGGENQRLKPGDNNLLVPADFNDDIVGVEGKEYIYRPRCLTHMEQPGEPAFKYSFPLLSR